MGLRKIVTKADNQTGDYWKLIRVSIPTWVDSIGWAGNGTLEFAIYKSYIDRQNGASVWDYKTMEVPADFFLGFTMPIAEDVAASIYASKNNIPGLEDAEDVLE